MTLEGLQARHPYPGKLIIVEGIERTLRVGQVGEANFRFD